MNLDYNNYFSIWHQITRKKNYMPYQSFIQIEKLTFTRKALIISNEGGSSLIKGDPYSLYVTICIITRRLCFNHFFRMWSLVSWMLNLNVKQNITNFIHVQKYFYQNLLHVQWQFATTSLKYRTDTHAMCSNYYNSKFLHFLFVFSNERYAVQNKFCSLRDMG